MQGQNRHSSATCHDCKSNVIGYCQDSCVVLPAVEYNRLSKQKTCLVFTVDVGNEVLDQASAEQV